MITGSYKLIANEGLWQNITSNQVRLDVDTGSAPATIELPLLSAIDNAMDVEIFINDAISNAGASNITIVPAIAPTVKGVSAIAIGSVSLLGDQRQAILAGANVTLAGLGANDGVKVVVSTSFALGVTTVVLAGVVVVPITAASTISYKENNINGLESIVINTNGGVMVVKPASANKWFAGRSAV